MHSDIKEVETLYFREIQQHVDTGCTEIYKKCIVHNQSEGKCLEECRPKGLFKWYSGRGELFIDFDISALHGDGLYFCCQACPNFDGFCDFHEWEITSHILTKKLHLDIDVSY